MTYLCGLDVFQDDLKPVTYLCGLDMFQDELKSSDLLV